jgi:hypothetical protein
METRDKIYRTALSEIFFDENGILCLKPKEDADLDLEEVEECFRIYRELGIGNEKNVLQLIITRGNLSMSREAREYVAKNGRDFFLASAIISDSLAVKLVVNFFNMFYRTHGVPFRMFNDRDSAIAWLTRFR